MTFRESQGESSQRQREGKRYALVLGLALFAATAVPAQEPLPPGDYAGWAYLDAGGDFPLRWSVREVDGKSAVTVSLTFEKAFDLATTVAAAPGGNVVVTLAGSGALSFTGAPSEGAVRGTLDANGQPGTFELVRSEVPLPSVRPEVHAGAEGVYRDEAGDALVVSAWPWGELRCLDLATGADRTLYATAADALVAGPTLGLPAPIEARYRVVRDDARAIVALERSAGQGMDARVYRRVPLAEEELRFPSGEAMLQGTLLAPAGASRRPAIVILGGSDVTLREHVQPTARVYAALGFAVLAYDLRGHGQSTGERDSTLAQCADDALAAVAALRVRTDIDPRHVGLAGTSRGGWTAPLAASRGPVSFLVLFVAPAVSPQRQLTQYWLASFAAAGHAGEDLEQVSSYLERLWRCTESDDDWARYAEARADMERRNWLALLGGPESRDSEEYHWQRLNAHYDPTAALERTTCPVLALFGEHDRVVDAAENLPRMEAALRRAGNGDATLRVIPGVDHGLWLTDPGHPARVHRARGFGPEVWSTVRRWLDERTRE